MSAIDLDDTDAAKWYEAILFCRAEIARYEEMASQAREQLEAYMGTAETARLCGKPVIRWKWERALRQYVDAKQLRERFPDVAAEVTRVAPERLRPFRILEDR